MSRHRRRRDGPTFIQVFHYVVDSDAYRDLSMTARAALVEIQGLYRGDNNGRLLVPARWLAERLGTHYTTAATVIRELDDHGFISPTKITRFKRNIREASEWRLTFYPERHRPSTADPRIPEVGRCRPAGGSRRGGR